MSGAEASLVIGLISSVITIVQATKQVYDAANDAEGLPEAFRDVAKKLPLVEDALQLAKNSVDNTTCAVIKPVIRSCEVKSSRLKVLFEKVIPKDGASRKEHYEKALRTVGKGSKVETLMEQILKELHLLANHQTFAVAAKLAELAAAIEELSKTPPSAPDFPRKSDKYTSINNGPGPQNNQNAPGDPKNYNLTGSGKMFNAQSQTFGAI
jgi:N-terminal domain on NACHT_NTPase and P-loop NTPases